VPGGKAGGLIAPRIVGFITQRSPSPRRPTAADDQTNRSLSQNRRRLRVVVLIRDWLYWAGNDGRRGHLGKAF